MSDQYQDMGESPDIEAQRVVSSEPVVTVMAAELAQLLQISGSLRWQFQKYKVENLGTLWADVLQLKEWVEGKLMEL